MANSALVGGISGGIEVLINHPLMTIKNDLQQANDLLEKPNQSLRNQWRQKTSSLDLSPAHLYRGVIPNAISMIGIIAVRVTISDLSITYFFGNVHKNEAPTYQRMLSAYSGGLCSCVITAPTELVILYQQKNNLSFTNAVMQYTENAKKPWKLKKGMLATGCRDGFFTLGFYAVTPMLKKQLQPSIQHDFNASLIAGTTAGVLSTLISHPFDVIKTKQQTSPGSQVMSLRKAATIIYDEKHFAGFFKGIVPRATRVVSAITILGYVTEKVEDFLDSNVFTGRLSK